MPKFEVRTIEWLPPEYGDVPCKARGPASASVHVWPTYAAAAESCERINAAAWAKPDFNPFLHGGEDLFFQTTLPPGPFCDWLEDHGLDPAPVGEAGTHADWVAWWELSRPTFSESQLVAVREAMNLVRFAEVVEVPDGTAKGYVVQELNWSWNDNPTLDADHEGGNFVAVYRSRAKADARCAELNAARQAQPDHEGYESFSTEGRAGAAEPHWTPIARTPFFEVVEVDLAGVPAEPQGPGVSP